MFSHVNEEFFDEMQMEVSYAIGLYRNLSRRIADLYEPIFDNGLWDVAGADLFQTYKAGQELGEELEDLLRYIESEYKSLEWFCPFNN